MDKQIAAYHIYLANAKYEMNSCYLVAPVDNSFACYLSCTKFPWPSEHIRPYHRMAIAAIDFRVLIVAILYTLPDGGSPTPSHGSGGGYNPTPTPTYGTTPTPTPSYGTTPTPSYGTTPTPSYGTTPSTPSTPSHEVPASPKKHGFIGSCE